MKYIIAVIKPHQLDGVRSALGKVGINGMTVTDTLGYGRQKGHTEVYRGAEYKVDFRPKTKIEVAVSDDLAEIVVQTIRDNANSGEIGDGKIFVLELNEAVRVRTGETGVTAL